MKIPTMLQRLLAFMSVSFICLYSALSFAAELENAAIYQQPRPIVPFSLKDTDGKAFSNQNLQGHWSLLFFGFTNCAMICPTTMTELNKMYGLLQKAKVKSLPQVVFISVDPERDSIKRIHGYVQAFNSAFVGATGSEQELTKLSKQLGVMYMKVRDKDDPKHYAIDHSAFIVLVNPKGQAYGLLTTPHSAKNLAHNYRKITDQA
jgi:protein SCO1/2